MADADVTDLTAVTTLASTDLLYTATVSGTLDRKITADDAATALAGLAGWTLIDEEHAIRSAGDLSVASNSNVWAEVSSALRITLSGAVTGDVVEYGVSTWGVGASASDLALNAATIVSGSIVNEFVTGTRTAAIGYVDSTTSKPIHGSARYTLQSGDISAGSVTCSLTASTGATLTIKAAGNYHMQYWAKLWRPPT